MNTARTRTPSLLVTFVVGIAVAAVALAGCSDNITPVDRANAKVAAKEKAVTEAEAALAAASDQFCGASETYIEALDRYGDILNETAPTVGDVRDAGADLVEPREDAFGGAEAAAEAQQALTTAQQELADAQAALADLQGSSATPSESAEPTSTPLAPAASIDRVKRAEQEFASAQEAITDQTPLSDASELFNSAAFALDVAWLRLFADTGCLSDDQEQQAAAAVTAYTTALQQDLAATGYYTGTVDGLYGPQTVQAVQALQKAKGLPVTGTVDKATAIALQEELAALSGAAAQESVATTAAIQQTLTLAGFWDGPIDGIWTPELTEAVKEFQIELGVEPTGVVDAATVAAFEKAFAELSAPEPTPTPSPSSTDEP
jgi:peptidoglycan hydrolase-like protein with peptidoglycan-binding domain